MNARRLALLPLLVLAACPTTEPEPADDDDGTPPAPWVLEGIAQTYDGTPVPGEEFAIGDEFQVTGADGRFAFEVPAGPPVQLDRTVAEDEIDSEVTCAASHTEWIWTGGSSGTEYATLRATLHGVEALGDLIVAWVYEDPQWEYVSRWTFRIVPESEGGDFVLERSVPPASRWAVVAGEATDAGAAWVVVEGEGAVQAGDLVELEATLESAAGSQPWDGIAPDGAVAVAFRERVEVMGTGVFLPVARLAAGAPATIPMLDGHLDVLEYSVQVEFAAAGGADRSVTALLPPLFPPDELSLPALPGPPEVAPVGGILQERLALQWSVPEGTEDVYLWIYTWDAAGADGPSWYVHADGGCGTRAEWPRRFEPLETGSTVWTALGAYGDGWSASCTTWGDL